MNEIKTNHQSGGNLYAIIRNSAGSVYSFTASSFVSYATNDLASYAIALNDAGGDLYQADFPSAITTPGVFFVIAYVRVGGSPSNTDPLVSAGEIDWDGSAEIVPVLGDDLISLDYAKEFMNITDSANDSSIGRRIHAASAAVRKYCGRPFKGTSYVETLNIDWDCSTVSLSNYPVTGITSVTTYPNDDAIAYPSTDFFVTTYGALCLKSSSAMRFFPRGFQAVRIEYTAGDATVPADVQEMTAMIVRNLYNQIALTAKSGYIMEQLDDYKYQLRADAFNAMTDDIKAVLDHHKRRRV